MVSEHAAPRAAKSAERIDGAIMAGGDMVPDGGMVCLRKAAKTHENHPQWKVIILIETMKRAINVLFPRETRPEDVTLELPKMG